MKNHPFVKTLPLLVLSLGVTGMGTRWMLYLKATDSRGLLTSGHPLEILLWLLTAAALILIGLAVRKQKGLGGYEDNFFPSWPAAGGQILGAFGIGITVLFGNPLLPGMLGYIWKILGLAAVPCLAAAGVFRGLGKKPFFLLHMIPCLFLVFHVVNHYQLWSSQPQLQNYVFYLFGVLAMALFAFYTSAFTVEIPRRQMQIFTGLAALYLCAVSLYGGDTPWLNLGCMAWAATGLCTLEPQPLFPAISEKILKADEPALQKAAPVLTDAIRELKPLVGFDQRSPHHAYDLYTHTAHVTAAVPEDLTLRWAALLHDVGKVPQFTVDENGRGHFKGHAQKGAEMADDILRRLNAPEDLREQVVYLVRHHMTWVPLETGLGEMDRPTACRLLLLQEADMASKGVPLDEKNRNYFHRFRQLLKEQ